MLELKLGALRDLSSDDAPALPILNATGPAPRAALLGEGGEDLGLAPGEYLFELRARALAGTLAPALIAVLSGGGERKARLSEVSPGVWRCALTADRSIASLGVALPGAVSLVVAGARIGTEEGVSQAAPTIIAGAVGLGRALFRKLPREWRRSLLASGRRAKWLAQVRKADSAGAQAPGGRLVVGDQANDAAALRADFDNRHGVARGLRRPEFTEAAPATPPQGAAKLFAFHLPQVHAIAEKDAWWGRGFTEWSNVAKAQPQFLGHYQPRLPGELGFYDLGAPGVLARQAQLARAYGVGAFCFHYYWFAGKRLLEAPLDGFLADRSIDIEFALCWANENWTRRWDGDDAQILIAQEHTLEDHARVFEDLARYMEDPRYLRVDGRPLLVVYRPDIIAHAREMTALWRQKAAQRGWSGLYLVAANAFRFDEPERLGFDALVEFPPHGFVGDPIGDKLDWLNPNHTGAVFDYGAVAAAEARRMRTAPPRGTVFPGVMPGWDNEARRPGAGVVYHDATPAAYGLWLRAAIERAARTLPADRRFVFINAWNEWAEGAYLEPDRAFGRAFLAETARALAGEARS